MRHLKGPLD